MHSHFQAQNLTGRPEVQEIEIETKPANFSEIICSIGTAVSMVWRIYHTYRDNYFNHPPPQKKTQKKTHTHKHTHTTTVVFLKD